MNGSSLLEIVLIALTANYFELLFAKLGIVKAKKPLEINSTVGIRKVYSQ